jgi:hypothetical protein
MLRVRFSENRCRVRVQRHFDFEQPRVPARKGVQLASCAREFLQKWVKSIACEGMDTKPSRFTEQHIIRPALDSENGALRRGLRARSVAPPSQQSSSEARTLLIGE